LRGVVVQDAALESGKKKKRIFILKN
jgi:hypothetical protein